MPQGHPIRNQQLFMAQGKDPFQSFVTHNNGRQSRQMPMPKLRRHDCVRLSHQCSFDDYGIWHLGLLSTSGAGAQQRTMDTC